MIHEIKNIQNFVSCFYTSIGKLDYMTCTMADYLSKFVDDGERMLIPQILHELNKIW